jgi:hypothetical protein
MTFSIFLVPIVWLLKSGAYVVVFRVRKIECSYLTCLLIAGAPLLLSLIPLPFPALLGTIAGIALAIYVTMHYTGVSLIPDGLFIPLGIEVVFHIGVWGFQEMV